MPGRGVSESDAAAFRTRLRCFGRVERGGASSGPVEGGSVATATAGPTPASAFFAAVSGKRRMWFRGAPNKG